eukprot:gnl/TRDRNA2_/TRDRNA2_63246_c0_seq1.p1 gnl/TRDRNA2_/TRDRNA2_63246_c0~~gnl/TRDRNA2_/TRDRNA2_63246_c0_seq1.p1  ORF type:complete len:158 (+),score=40.78 gnl/TRDRNA2_/TRDRNA2_63246_c0_seq1:61-534(+)
MVMEATQVQFGKRSLAAILEVSTTDELEVMPDDDLDEDDRKKRDQARKARAHWRQQKLRENEIILEKQHFEEDQAEEILLEETAIMVGDVNCTDLESGTGTILANGILASADEGEVAKPYKLDHHNDKATDKAEKLIDQFMFDQHVNLYNAFGLYMF